MLFDVLLPTPKQSRRLLLPGLLNLEDDSTTILCKAGKYPANDRVRSLMNLICINTAMSISKLSM
jgi:hypothetical protein